jgi:hypothetical protein
VRSRTLLALGTLLVAVASLAGCSDGPGPLGSGGVAGTQCNPSAVGVPVTEGIYVLANTGTSPLTVSSVRLPSPQGLTMTRAWLVPVDQTAGGGGILIGAGYPYPPTSTAEWSRRVAIPGAVIKPHDGLNLVFGLTRTTARWGRTDGPIVTYTAGDTTYTLQEQTGFVITAAASC